MFGMSVADTIRIILMGIFILISIVITVVVLMQESKQKGLSGAISGAADTYWGKNKGRSMEGKLVTITKVVVVPSIPDISDSSYTALNSLSPK